jgi:peptide/nickel transport system ATP-binding protein
MSSNETAPELVVEGLDVRFRRREGEIPAVRDVSFSLAKGEVLTILGESGSGKSVTLKALMGLLPAYAQVAGSIRLGGRDLRTLPPAELVRLRGSAISMVFQEPMVALDPVYSIGHQIAETVVQHEGVSYATARQRALQ